MWKPVNVLITILNIYIGFNKGSNDSDSEYGMYKCYITCHAKFPETFILVV